MSYALITQVILSSSTENREPSQNTDALPEYEFPIQN